MAAVAGAALAVGVIAAPSPHRCGDHVVQRLELHAYEQPGAYYATAFRDGDVFVTLHDGEAKPLVFKHRVYSPFGDRCHWLATEKLYPEGPHRYLYTYDEEILSCAPGATPSLRTPRTGYVVVVDQQ